MSPKSADSFWPALLFFFLLVNFGFLPNVAGEEGARIHFAHALKAKEEGDLLEAERLLRKAIDLESHHADPHFELGNLLILKDGLREAQREFEQAIMIDPRHLASHYNLGLVDRELALMSEAREEFRQVLEIDPQQIQAQLQIGYTYQEEGFLEEARQAFQTAREMDWNHPEPLRALEDLDEFESQMRERSRVLFRRKTEQNERLLGLLARERARQT